MSTTDEKDPNSPATTSAAYDFMSPRWTLIETLLGGTEAMREAGELYAPRHTEETEDGYQDRLEGSVLLNMVEQTLDTLSGKPFCEEMNLGDDVPDAIIEQVLPDVDLQGNNLEVFARRWFREGMAKAFSHVLIDYPRPEPVEEGQRRTLADDRREGLRPYWNMIKPEAVLFARAEVIGGVEVLQHVRIWETYTEQDGFAEVHKARIRVLEPGLVQLWEPMKAKGNKEPEWRMVEEWETGLSYVPLVTFYAHREGFMTGKPPLLDLAHLNVTHWQSTSDQRHILTVARFPILACEGASEEDGEVVTIGPNKILYGPGKFKYIEHTGASIEAGRQDLKDLEEKMAGYGAEFLKARPGTATATARALDSAEASSDLAQMVGVFQDAIAQCLDITAEWMRIQGGGGTIDLNKDFGLSEEDTAKLAAVEKARERRDISRKAYLNVLKLSGALPEDYDAEADWEEIQEELAGMGLMGGAFGDLDPNARDGEEEDDDNATGGEGDAGGEGGEE